MLMNNYFYQYFHSIVFLISIYNIVRELFINIKEDNFTQQIKKEKKNYYV